MNPEIFDTIIGLSFVAIFFFGFFGFILFAVHIENKHELKKLGIVKPISPTTTINLDYKEKLKYQIKSWIITIVAIIIIGISCKLFGFSIKDITDLLK